MPPAEPSRCQTSRRSGWNRGSPPLATGGKIGATRSVSQYITSPSTALRSSLRTASRCAPSATGDSRRGCASASSRDSRSRCTVGSASSSASSGAPPACASSNSGCADALRREPRYRGARRPAPARRRRRQRLTMRRAQASRLVAHQHEIGIRRRLLERLQQRVGGRSVHRLGRNDHGDFRALRDASKAARGR